LFDPAFTTDFDFGGWWPAHPKLHGMHHPEVGKSKVFRWSEPVRWPWQALLGFIFSGAPKRFPADFLKIHLQ